jgi:hypothetical protein
MRYSTPLIAFVAMIFAHAAYAQDTVVTAEPWVVTFMPFVQLLITGIIGLLTTFLGLYMKAKYNIEWEKEQRDAFQTSATNAAGLYIQRVGAQAAMATVDVHSAALKEALDYLAKGAPTAIRHWGITPERITKILLAKISQVLPVEIEPTPISQPISQRPGSAGSTAGSTWPDSPTVRSPWIIGAAVLIVLAACSQIHTQLTELTGDEAKATCIEVASMDAAQQSSPFGIDLFLKLAQAGLACYMLPTTPGTPSEVVALPAEVPPPPQAQEVVPPPAAMAVIQDEI